MLKAVADKPDTACGRRNLEGMLLVVLAENVAFFEKHHIHSM